MNMTSLLFKIHRIETFELEGGETVHRRNVCMELGTNCYELPRLLYADE